MQGDRGTLLGVLLQFLHAEMFVHMIHIIHYVPVEWNGGKVVVRLVRPEE